MKTYIGANGQRLGPFEDAEILEGLASGRYQAEDLAWREGMVEWQPVRSLFPAGPIPPPLRGRSGAAVPPPTPAMGDDFGMRLLLPVGRSGWAICAGYLGLFCLIVFPAPIALIVSIVAIVDIRKSRGSAHPKHGMGRAIFGLIMGALGTLILTVVVVATALRR